MTGHATCKRGNSRWARARLMTARGGPLKGLFNARMNPRGVGSIARAILIQGGGTGRDREAASYSGHVRERPRAPDHQHYPHARDGRGAGGEVGAPRDTDGDGSGGLLSVAGVPALRSRRSHLAEPGSVRALDGPRVDAALFDARARGREGGERQVRAAGPARPNARRHQALPSAGQKGTSPPRTPHDLRRRGNDRPAWT